MGSGEEVAVSASAFYSRFLLKTAVRSVIWFGAAYLIIDRWPSLSWLWYVVAAFIIIGIGISLLALTAARLEAGNSTDENS